MLVYGCISDTHTHPLTHTHMTRKQAAHCQDLLTRVRHLLLLHVQLLPMRAITEGDPEGAAIYKGWACDNLACLEMDAGDRVLRSALDSRQWALLAFEVTPEIVSFEVTCTAEAGELYLSYLYPPSYKYNKYNASSGNRYRNAGHGQGSEAGLDFGRAGRQVPNLRLLCCIFTGTYLSLSLLLISGVFNGRQGQSMLQNAS
jgi:hypothetical protein